MQHPARTEGPSWRHGAQPWRAPWAGQRSISRARCRQGRAHGSQPCGALRNSLDPLPGLSWQPRLPPCPGWSPPGRPQVTLPEESREPCTDRLQRSRASVPATPRRHPALSQWDWGGEQRCRGGPHALAKGVHPSLAGSCCPGNCTGSRPSCRTPGLVAAAAWLQC